MKLQLTLFFIESALSFIYLNFRYIKVIHTFNKAVITLEYSHSFIIL